MKISKGELYRIMRFGIIGVLATGIHYGTYLILLLWLSPSISYTGGYAVGFCVNYVLTTYFTFRTKSSVRNATGFTISHVINYLLELGVLNIFLYFGMGKQLAGIVTLIAVTPVNYLILRLVYLWKR